MAVTRYDRSAGRLVGSRCDACGAASWPPRRLCNRCGGRELSVLDFSGRATLLTFTTVMVPRPGVEAPYVLGQARLDEGPLVLGQVRQLGNGAEPPLAARVIVSADPDVAPPFWLEPA